MSGRLVFGVREILLATLFMVSACVANAQSPPTAPALAYGTYTVSVPLQGAVTLLQEKVGANGTWTTIYSTSVQYPGGTSTLSFTKPPGTYSYRTYVMYTSYYGGTYGVYSTEITVQVQSGPAPTQDRMSSQLRYAYEARIGDINGDGQQDLFVRRTSGGQTGNGTLDNVILRRLSDGRFSPDVPTASQVSTASGWPVTSTPIKLRDVNLDGYADVVLPNVGSVISGSSGQIVFSPGVPGSLAAQRATPMNAKYNKFTDDMVTWIADPNYFVNHAQIYYQPVYGYIYYCDYYFTENGYQYLCTLSSGIIGYQAYYDFSPWDPDAVLTRYSFNQTNSNGTLKPDVIAGSQDAKNISTYFTNVFGVPYMRGILNSTCNDYQYDTVVHLPCIDYGLLGQIILAMIKAEKPDDWDYRLLTEGEKQLTRAEGLLITGIDQTRVYNHGYRAFFYTYDNYIVTPDGNVYIGKTQTLLPFGPDYSPNWPYFSILLHELTHVYQCNDLGICGVELFIKRGGLPWNGNYVYMPIDKSKPFSDYSIEQQAEMMQDRFRLRRDPVNGVLRSGNAGANLTDLNAVIPFRETY